MIYIRFIVLCLFILASSMGLAQQTRPMTMRIATYWGQGQFALDQWLPVGNSDSCRIGTFRFYLGHIQLSDHDKVVWSDEVAYHLIDASDSSSSVLNLRLPRNLVFDRLSFQLGVDSMTQVAGALGGALDPTNGMYWTWQSGYINLKLEGYSSHSKEPTHEFQYHLGGYIYPESTIQSLSFPAVQTAMLQLGLDLRAFVEGMQGQPEHLMSPGPLSVQSSHRFASCFSLNSR